MMADYKITFSQNPLLALWTWRIKTPDGRTLAPFNIGFKDKPAAERDAMRRIRLDQSTETVSGDELAARVGPELARAASSSLRPL